MSQIYQVPVTCNGLRETESILQIVDSLEKLEKVFNEIYTNISSRVSHEKSRIDDVSNRLDNAQYKVKQIAGSKSAMTVFSSAKYPADKKWGDYVPIYTGKTRLPFKQSHHHLHNENQQIKKVPEDSYLDINDLVFIEKSIDAASKEIEVKEGLGRLPNHLPSVSNLLLFNTQENPYKKYSNTLDNLAGASGEEVQLFGEKKKALHAAPITVEMGDIRPEAENVKIKYQPGNFATPVYNFPSALPLPNVAENITWAAEQTSIAPSQQPSAASVLPTFDANSGGDAGQQPPVQDGSVPPPPPPMSNTSPTTYSSAPPPPPPPPMSNNAPPPPPPPPMMSNAPPPPPMMQSSNDNDDSDNDSDPGDGSAIGSLLADIRKGHKSRLKKVTPKTEDDEPPPAPKPKGGDLMGDLFLALTRRRQSIGSTKSSKKSTKKDKDESESDNQSDGDSDSDSAEWN
ncbi:hypothetical protein CYY_008928 [Polysphondylium violaceum]|uniref:WH2 domain-containing protein n=1 Tax=Polysphondylium violaceum TaxID=133409 RepID=A0A8J4V0W4_9MYCE|nr:hypothetical protein CYY_008928 [Polysphondylium violaceum]